MTESCLSFWVHATPNTQQKPQEHGIPLSLLSVMTWRPGVWGERELQFSSFSLSLLHPFSLSLGLCLFFCSFHPPRASVRPTRSLFRQWCAPPLILESWGGGASLSPSFPFLFSHTHIA